MSAPNDPDDPPKGFFREYFRGFFADFYWHDWLEFAFYCLLAVGAVAVGVAWLAGRF